MNIERDYQVCNDSTCIEYTYTIPHKDYFDEKAGGWKTEEVKISDTEKKKIMKEVRKTVQPGETIIAENVWNTNFGIEFEIRTREEWRTQKEEQYKQLLRKHDIPFYEHEFDLNENNWLCFETRMAYTEENITKTKKVLKARTWKVGYDSHMECIFLMFDMRDEVKT